MTRPVSTQKSWEIKFLKSPTDGSAIRYAVRQGDSSKRAVLFLNGRSEYIEKYQDLADDTDFFDCTWVMMDHRGQGASEGLKSHVSSYEVFAKDAQAVVTETIGSQNYVLIAHSMGGLIALYGTMKGILRPDALVLCSPLFGIFTPMPLFLAKVVARLLNHTPIRTWSTGANIDRREKFEGNILTQSKERFERMSASAFRGSPPTFGWIQATFEGLATIFNRRNIQKLKIPVAIIVGDKEKVVDRLAYEGWIKSRETLSGTKTSFKLVPGAEHELLNEDDKYRDIALAFINETLKAI